MNIPSDIYWHIQRRDFVDANGNSCGPRFWTRWCERNGLFPVWQPDMARPGWTQGIPATSGWYWCDVVLGSRAGRFAMHVGANGHVTHGQNVYVNPGEALRGAWFYPMQLPPERAP